MKIEVSYILKQEILKYLYQKNSITSGIQFYISDDELIENLKPIFEQINIDIKYREQVFIDDNPLDDNRLIINVHDVKNVLDDLEKEGYIRQDSSKTAQYHTIILTLKGKEFYHKGGYSKNYFVKKWIIENRAEIIAFIAIIISIVALFV